MAITFSFRNALDRFPRGWSTASESRCTALVEGFGEPSYIFIRTIQELLGHADVKTTMIYTHVSTIGASGVRSPLDSL